MEKERAALRHFFPARKDFPHPVTDVNLWLRLYNFPERVCSFFSFLESRPVSFILVLLFLSCLLAGFYYEYR